MCQKIQLHLRQVSAIKKIAAIIKENNDAIYLPRVIRAFIRSERKRLFKAIKENNITKVTQFSKSGFALNTTNKKGNTLLHQACKHSRIEIVRLLIGLMDQNSQLIERNNKDGKTPLELLMAHTTADSLKALFGLLDQDSKKRKSDYLL